MYQCPICGAYMNFNMGYYSLYQPYTYYNCSCCGYDSRVNTRTTTSNNTGNVQIRPTYTVTSCRLSSVDRIFGTEKTTFSNTNSVFG